MPQNQLNAQEDSRLILWGAALLLLVVHVSIFWRPYFFFLADDWTGLRHMVENPFWQYLNHEDAEQWFPFFHLIYYLVIKAAGDNYSLLVMINCLLTGANVILVLWFLRFHFGLMVAFYLSAVYALSSVHTATDWHAYNICYILALGFFMSALLLTRKYIASPSFYTLLGIGLLAWLSITSHSFAIMVIGTIPLYGFLLNEHKEKPIYWRLAIVIAIVYLFFLAGYFTFAGFSAATSHNTQIFSKFPGPAYLGYWFYGAVIHPFCYLLGGVFNPIKSLIIGLIIFGVAAGVIFFKGEAREKEFAVWALSLNALPFFLVGLARYKLGVSQAVSHRYGVFTLIGALFLVASAWLILARNLPRRARPWVRILPIIVAPLIIYGQLAAILKIQEVYKKRAQTTLSCYQKLEGKNPSDLLRGDISRPFCSDPDFITYGQALSIRKLLEGGK